ncbi:MAG: VWA domain-containing protein [Spirochaetales bacterium]|nr:VWA domain-containing protein [Spirochaetales bacterium]
MWTVEEPLYLFLLFLFIPGIYLVHLWPRRGGVFDFSFGLWGGESFQPPLPFLRGLGITAAVLLWTGIGCLVLALAGPVRVEKERIYLNQGIDILFVLDESPSMGAEDFAPLNRFETAKELIAQFVRRRENDALGLVTFGDQAVLRVPPTADYRDFLARLEEQKLGPPGRSTSLGLGLGVAALHLQHSSAPRQVIVLLTDGENNSGEISPQAAAGIVASRGIVTYTIGIGSLGEVPMTAAFESGRVYEGYYQSHYNEELLREIARITGGRFFSASGAGALDQVFQTIDSLESAESRIRIRAIPIPAHRSAIYLGLILILSSYAISRLLLREVI